jgi:hypothetical protein
MHVTFQRRRQPRQVVFQFSRVAGYTPADCRKLAAQTVNRIFAARHMCTLFSRLIYWKSHVGAAQRLRISKQSGPR